MMPQGHRRSTKRSGVGYISLFSGWSAILGNVNIQERITRTSKRGIRRWRTNIARGEIFYPSVDVLSQALLQDWEATAKLAEKDLEVLGQAGRGAGVVPQVGSGPG
jgi:hypothetical protein